MYFTVYQSYNKINESSQSNSPTRFALHNTFIRQRNPSPLFKGIIILSLQERIHTFTQNKLCSARESTQKEENKFLLIYFIS